MTKEQQDICLALGKVSYLPAEPEKELSEKQNEWMYRLLYKYRKQLPNTYERV
jgi:hypothetical protein